MKPSETSSLNCRHCRYYMPEGRRGGHCQQLSVSVQSSWKACSLAVPPFTPAWETLEGIMIWQRKALAMQEATVSSCTTVSEQLETDDLNSTPSIAPANTPVKTSVRWM